MKTKKKPLLIVKRKKGSKWKFPIKDKQTIKPEELFPIIFTGIRRNNKALKDAEKLIGSDLIDDIEFAKVTANKKELFKKYGKGFELAYNAYKKGKGAKGRKKMAEELKANRKKKKEPPNPQPNNPYMKLIKGEWHDMSPSALAERIKAMRDKTLEPLKPIIELSAKIQKANEALSEPARKLKKAFDTTSILTGRPIEYKFNPFSFGNLHNKSLLNDPAINHGLLSKKIIGKNLKIPPRIKPDGHKRKAIVGTGLTSYMERHKLINPVDFAKVYKTKSGKDYDIKGYENLRFLCEQMNVNVEEALLYICEGMTSTKTRWKEHRLNKEYWRGSQSVINLVDYFDEQVRLAKKKKMIAYTIKALWNDSYTTRLFSEYGCDKGSYSEFSRWFKKMKHHVYAYRLAKNMRKKN